MITPDQIEAARKLLGWSYVTLAKKSGWSLATVVRLETSAVRVAHRERAMTDIQAALEAAGVIFVAENGAGSGVRLKKTT